MIKIGKDNEVYITTCSKDKVKTNQALPLYKLYDSPYHDRRKKFIELFSGVENYLYCTPSGGGIVPGDFRSLWYDKLTPDFLLESRTFIQEQRELALKLIPELAIVEKIYFFGDERYLSFLRKVFLGKRVIFLLSEEDIDKQIQYALIEEYLYAYRNKEDLRDDIRHYFNEHCLIKLKQKIDE